MLTCWSDDDSSDKSGGNRGEESEDKTAIREMVGDIIKMAIIEAIRATIRMTMSDVNGTNSSKFF